MRNDRTLAKGSAPTLARRLCGVTVPEFTIRPMTAADAHAVAAWRYPGEYSFYDADADPDDLAELLDPSGMGAAVLCRR